MIDRWTVIDDADLFCRDCDSTTEHQIVSSSSSKSRLGFKGAIRTCSVCETEIEIRDDDSEQAVIV